METIISSSPEETREIARDLGRKLTAGDTVTLTGELGAGKTLFSKGIAEGMGIKEEITSPSFSLLEIYESTIPLYHFDLYRLHSQDELDELQFEEYWEGDGVSIIEWPDRAGERLPKHRININIEYIDSTNRRITIEHSDN